MNGCLTEQTTNEWMFNRTDKQTTNEMNGCFTGQTTNEWMFNRTDNKLVNIMSITVHQMHLLMK